MPFKKAVLMSRWSMFKSSLLAMASSRRMVVGSVMGAYTWSGLKSRPCFWRKPRTQMRALNFSISPLLFILIFSTTFVGMTLRPTGVALISKVPFSTSDAISAWIAAIQWLHSGEARASRTVFGLRRRAMALTQCARADTSPSLLCVLRALMRAREMRALQASESRRFSPAKT